MRRQHFVFPSPVTLRRGLFVLGCPLLKLSAKFLMFCAIFNELKINAACLLDVALGQRCGAALLRYLQRCLPSLLLSTLGIRLNLPEVVGGVCFLT